MNSELIAAFDYYEREKGIKREVLAEAVVSALRTAYIKRFGEPNELRIELAPRTGDIRVFVTCKVVERVLNDNLEVGLGKARQFKPSAQLGEMVEVEIPATSFGRIAAQTARQAISQRVRMAEKEMLFEEFKDRAGEIVTGTVRRFERSDVIVDLGKFEAVMPHSERVSTEDYNVGDRLRAYVLAVENGAGGPKIILSRKHQNFVRRLFETEVAEIADRTVEIRALAREAGYRTKVAVHSANDKVDPVGACVGVKGNRVKNIVRELNNEKVDIIKWHSEPREMVLEAIKPAKVKNIVLVPEKKTVIVKVDEDQLSLAIGKRGQNARLTAKLTGWEISIEKDESVAQQFGKKVHAAAAGLVDALGVTEAEADALVNAGMGDLETLSSVDADDITGSTSIDAERAAYIVERVRARQSSTSVAG
ncbi:MAG: transcription termination/antitermination protein NusA [Verrucomicrobia bacterium]|nr:transcription termination/antitermination protein NusA [Verrucomicrobiota bacterium]